IDVTIDFFLKHIAPEDIDRLSNLAKVSLELKQSQEVEYNIITADNKHKMLSSLLTKKITNEKGDIIKIIGATRDITLIKVYEDQLQRQMDNLSKSNKDLEEFAYIASHDLQEPLRKISTFSGKLASKYGEALGEDGNMFIERVLASADNMRTLIDNLLEFSRITKGEQSYTETSLNFIVQQVLQQLELSIEETSAEINIGKLPVLQASPTQLKQVFDNIIRNAIKFRKKDITPKIGISSSVLSVIEKEVHKLSIGTVYHKIFIEDNGIGFESEYASRIFQIFQRLHGKSQYPGSGIGLAICKKIVENHHGLIFAENIPSSGARFIIILPERQTQ
ncbi:MAG: ATP-binding protein, partial [Bacteroidota bacterium]